MPGKQGQHPGAVLPVKKDKIIQNVDFYQVSTDNFGEIDSPFSVDFPEKSGIVYMRMLTVLTCWQDMKNGTAANCIFYLRCRHE